jgi:hypothetical protein
MAELFNFNGYEMSAQQCPNHCSSEGNGIMLNVVVHQNGSQLGHLSSHTYSEETKLTSGKLEREIVWARAEV